MSDDGPLFSTDDTDTAIYWTCRTCHTVQRVVEEHDETKGFEEKAKPIRVLDLGCGHSTELPGRWSFSD